MGAGRLIKTWITIIFYYDLDDDYIIDRDTVISLYCYGCFTSYEDIEHLLFYQQPAILLRRTMNHGDENQNRAAIPNSNPKCVKAGLKHSIF